MKFRIAVCLIAIVLLSCTKTAERTSTPNQPQQQAAVSSAVTSTSGAGAPLQFGFADKTGKRLRALDFQEQPNALTRAACSGTEMLLIRFTGRKDASQANTSRDIADNFDAGGGFYYEIRSGEATEGITCLMTDERFLAGKKAVQVISGADKPDKKTMERIAQAKKRGVKEAWGLARIDPDRTFSAIPLPVESKPIG